MKKHVHDYIRFYYPQYDTIEYYPATQCARVCRVADEWGIFFNFAQAPIIYNGITFDCAERLFQYRKFKTDAEEGKAALLAAKKGRALKMCAKHIFSIHPEWQRNDWGAVIVDVMKECLLLKYQQSASFREELQHSMGLFIVEDQTSFPNKNADSWGTKLVDDEYIGPNLLGRLLMELRNDLEKFAQSIYNKKDNSTMSAPSPNIQAVWFLHGNLPEKQHPRKRRKNEAFPVHMSDDDLRQGNFAWLPIEGTDFRIVFNESEDSMSRFLKHYDFGILLWAFPEDDPHDIDYLPIPQVALVRAYDKFNEIITHIKETHSKYAEEYDRFLSELLKRNKTEKHYYLYRTLLYGDLFNKQFCD